MVLFPKEPQVWPAMRIYRGDDPTIRDLPIKKTEDIFEKKFTTFSDRMKWAFGWGLYGGLTWSLADIYMISRITDRRVQIARTAYFTLPALTATCGWMAALEISKRALGRENYQEAYVCAALAPATVFSVWRQRAGSFPKIFAVAALLGVIYQKSVDENLYWGSGQVWENPNDQYDAFHKNMSIFGEARRYEWRHGDKKAMFHQVADPGPTYAKFE